MRRNRTRNAVALLALVLTLMSVADARATHVSCGDTLIQDTRLDSDLIDCPPESTLVLGANGITLDLGGHTIDGTGRGFGVTNRAADGPGFNDVTVRGGTIKEFGAAVAFTLCTGCVLERTMITASYRGVWFTNVDAGRIERNSISSIRAEGVFITDSPGNQIAHNSIRDNGADGIAINYSSANAVFHNSLQRNGRDGIFGFASDDLRLVRNFVDRNGRYGASLRFSQGGQVRGNWASGNAVDGIAFTVEVTDSRMLGNVAFGNARSGISLGQADRNRVIANVMASNGASGAQLGNELGTARETRVAHNLAVRNAVDGIAVSPLSTGTTLRANIVSDNTDDGIDVDEPLTALGLNSANRNDDLGVEAVAGVTDEGGNRAKRNGNRLQCTNVVCRRKRDRRGRDHDHEDKHGGKHHDKERDD
jgi:parallel beta-helix repeat protein